MNFDSIKRLHVVGIGGIGVSALAKYFALAGIKVSGSDAFDSEIVREAGQCDIAVTIGHAANNVPADADLIFFSDAVPEDNPERKQGRALGIPEISYAKLLGELSKTKKTIAVSGTNGKSTVTAMVGLILERAGWDPTVIVGSKVKSFPLGNLRVGASEWLIVEADEYRAHLLELSPEAAIITNIELDHLDYYRDLNHIRDTFFDFSKLVPPEGIIAMNADDPISAEVMAEREKLLGVDAARVTYGMEFPALFMARNITHLPGRQSFDLLRTEFHEEIFGEFSLRIPGRFNVMNALSAASLCISLGVDPSAVREALSDFSGVWRRFEVVGKLDGESWREERAPIIISDYGHHPTSISGTLSAAREFYPGRRLVLVFQPHQHNRTKKLFDDFVRSFAGADVLILSDIYDVPGREEAEDQDVSSRMLADAVRRRGLASEVRDGGGLEETEKLIKSMARANDIILIMGAGSIDEVARNLVK